MPAAKGTRPWNAGTSQGWVDKRGYRWLYVTENGKQVARREHRVLMEQHLGRKLEPWEIIHHKDGTPSNNDIANLELTTYGEHTARHNQGARKSWETRRTMEAFALMREELKRERAIKAELLEALQTIIDWADLALRNPQEFNSHGVRNLVGPAFDDARAAIAKATGP